MKCPKCQYLGFETGDRCKNCGYDFSLIEFRTATEDDLRPAPAVEPRETAVPSWDNFNTPRDLATVRGESMREPAGIHQLREPAADQSTEPALPLFAANAEDQPLVRLPVTPRRPLAVRRTPENPRLRNVPKVTPEVEPELEFADEVPLPRLAPPAPQLAPTSILRMEEPPPAPPHVGPQYVELETSSARRRCIAAIIDYALLFGIDLAIVYFTVRMAGLDLANWRLLPVVPLALFLVVIGLAYVGVFTAIGGQTIGKMAARIRVVPEDPEPPGAFYAFRRTAAVFVSWLTVGLGFLPALVGDHRALHDRLSRTRVVDLESA